MLFATDYALYFLALVSVMFIKSALVYNGLTKDGKIEFIFILELQKSDNFEFIFIVMLPKINIIIKFAFISSVYYEHTFLNKARRYTNVFYFIFY